MNIESLREVVYDAIQRHPGLIFGILNNDDTSQENSCRSDPNWCKCGNCKEMPTPTEQVCCNKKPENCIAMLPVCF